MADTQYIEALNAFQGELAVVDLALLKVKRQVDDEQLEAVFDLIWSRLHYLVENVPFPVQSH